MIRLHDFPRSSASYRVRIALNLKDLPYEVVSWDLRSGAHQTAAYADLNPQQLVPSLAIDGLTLFQSLAIIDYLEETRPLPALLPNDAAARARVRAMAMTVACDVHPLNNLRVLRYLEDALGCSAEDRSRWYAHWVGAGFSALEAQLRDSAGRSCCSGDTPTVADVCLVPQVYNARRFGVDLTPYPALVRIADALTERPAFAAAHPDRSAPAS